MLRAKIKPVLSLIVLEIFNTVRGVLRVLSVWCLQSWAVFEESVSRICLFSAIPVNQAMHVSRKSSSLIAGNAPCTSGLQTCFFQDRNITRNIQKDNFPEVRWFQTLLPHIMGFKLPSWEDFDKFSVSICSSVHCCCFRLRNLKMLLLMCMDCERQQSFLGVCQYVRIYKVLNY